MGLSYQFLPGCHAITLEKSCKARPLYFPQILRTHRWGSTHWFDGCCPQKNPNLRHMIPTYSYIGAVLLRQFSGGFKKEHSTEGCWSAGHWAVDPDLAHLKRLRPPEGRTKCRPRTNLEKEHLIPLFHLFSGCVFPFLKCTFNAASAWVHLKMICAPQIPTVLSCQ